MFKKQLLIFLTACLSLIGGEVVANEQQLTSQLAVCQQTAEATKRLACFDALAKQALPDEVASDIGVPENAKAESAQMKNVAGVPVEPVASVSRKQSYLTKKWHLNKKGDSSSLTLGPLETHRQNYLVTSISSNTNDVTQTPSQAASNNRELQNKDVHFQISLKTQLWEEVPLMQSIPWVESSRVWAAYTQRSYWQMFDGGASRPFRETNFAPELILSLGLKDNRPSWMPRMLNIAAIHESNGRENPLSRSWNRIYLEGGWELGDAYTVIARPWWKIPEGQHSDNPDISRYLGYGDLTLRWDPLDSNHSASVLLRNNLRSDNKGYIKLNYFYQISDHIKWYMMLSSGYGESLLDYNQSQSLLGFGLAVGQ